MMIKVSDYIAKRLVEHNIDCVFMIPGGGAMHLNDSIGNHPSIKYICNHHEQASAIGAEGYARASGRPGCVVVTSGPGGTNTITGVLGQWTDSIPVVYISGQVKASTTVTGACPTLPLRQLGDQEADIISLVKPITKMSEQIVDPLDTKLILDKAIYAATHGRPGPVWIDVPLNVQGAMVDEEALRPFIATSEEPLPTGVEISALFKMIKDSKRPLIIAGHGIRISGGTSEFLSWIGSLGIPVVSSFNGYDIIPSDHPLYVGRIGTLGTRAGNFALQNADLVICIGSRNNIRQASYAWDGFASRAKKIIVDIDRAELHKPTIIPHLAICADAKRFIELCSDRSHGEDFSQWVAWCMERKRNYPVVSKEMRDTSSTINMYHFADTLTRQLPASSVLVAGNATATISVLQAGNVRPGQRVIWNSGCAAMGYDLPAAIGAHLASGKDVVCLAGDGSIMMNLQELATVAGGRLPIKIFVLNNNGYISMKQTQSNFFNGKLVACDQSSGVYIPSFEGIAKGFNIKYNSIRPGGDMMATICQVLAHDGPVICEVAIDPDSKFMPKSSSEKKPDGTMVSKPLEDMWPFLDREELAKNII